MRIVHLNEGKYVNTDRMTYTEPARGGGMIVYFAVGGGDIGGPACYIRLDQAEALLLRQFLDAQAKGAS